MEKCLDPVNWCVQGEYFVQFSNPRLNLFGVCPKNVDFFLIMVYPVGIVLDSVVLRPYLYKNTAALSACYCQRDKVIQACNYKTRT